MVTPLPRPGYLLGKLWVCQLTPDSREHSVAWAGNPRWNAVGLQTTFWSCQHFVSGKSVFPQFVILATGALNLLGFSPLVSGEIPSRGTIFGFNKGCAYPTNQGIWGLWGLVSVMATARSGTAGQSTRAERGNQTQRSVWTGPLPPSGRCTLQPQSIFSSISSSQPLWQGLPRAQKESSCSRLHSKIRS